MMKKKSLIIYFIILQFFFCGVLLTTLNHKTVSSSTCDYYDLKSSAVAFSNATVVSDGYNGSYWNDGKSYDAAIAIDSSDKVHLVWEDTTDGVWGTDAEIMYATYINAIGWSNATVISDGYNGSYWNGGGSYNSAIAIDSSDKVHVVWADQTDGVWGIDSEIMYATNNNATGWSNAIVISDGYNGIYWNDCQSRDPTIAISINEVHVVWEDNTDGVWGTDFEIMHINFEIPVPPIIIPGSIPFGNFYLLFIAISIIGLVTYRKRKK
jgi:deoxycytidylate deaminase